MNPHSKRFQHENRTTESTRTPTSVRLQPSGKDRELVEVNHAFQVLMKRGAHDPSAAEWRDFSRKLTARLELDQQEKSLGKWAQTIRDRFIATDSVAVRALGYVCMALIILLAVALLWIGSVFTLSLFEGPAYASFEFGSRVLGTVFV